MILSDNDILLAKDKKEIGIKPYRKKYLRPSSYELHLGQAVMFYNVNSQEERVVDTKLPSDDLMAVEVITKEYGAFVPPGGFVVAGSEEVVELDVSHTARICGTLVDTLGLLVAAEDEVVEPGMKTRIMFKIHNVSPCAIKVYPGMPIARIVFEELKSPSGLSGKSKGSDAPTLSKIHKRFK